MFYVGTCIMITASLADPLFHHHLLSQCVSALYLELYFFFLFNALYLHLYLMGQRLVFLFHASAISA